MLFQSLSHLPSVFGLVKAYTLEFKTVIKPNYTQWTYVGYRNKVTIFVKEDPFSGKQPYKYIDRLLV